ncbi:MAG: hypothetical protein QXX55_01655 [Candidatus Pacearchaeota archaeon]
MISEDDRKRLNINLVMAIFGVIIIIMAVIAFNLFLSKKNLDKGFPENKTEIYESLFKNFLIGSVSAQTGKIIYYNEGWVGIGTSNPMQTLNVVGSFNVTGPVFLQSSICPPSYFLTTTNVGQLICINLSSIGGGISTTIIGNVSGEGANGRIAFWNSTKGLTSNSRLFWDDGNMRLGVGTNNPTHSLSVIGNANITGGLILGNGLNLTSGNLTISLGRLGIGVSNPSTDLDIMGNLRLRDPAGGSYGSFSPHIPCDASKEGTFEYYTGCFSEGIRKSEVAVCMRSGPSSFSWQVIKNFTWPGSCTVS